MPQTSGQFAAGTSHAVCMTIRKNAHKRILQILNAAVLIKEFKYDDHGDTADVATPFRVLTVGKEFEFDRIKSFGDVTTFHVHRNWSFTAYGTVEAARRNLTPQAFAKYFPNAVESVEIGDDEIVFEEWKE